ncbi:MAG: hypothetical protein HYY65_00350 [Candidatus Tectomicrobia bacterium]|uniref:Tripartite tricarboxylate transporter substrate binding protein n=1 Tax=Tectimicrobiota bacterium TaxID=2528274 RepID=A0A932GM20_UNCTE|nr:hypothetical protein [Candidatus Tectomicrobia bacterium]
MKAIHASAVLLAVALLLGAAWGPVAASTPTSPPPSAAKEFFRGKDITLVPMTSTGTYDFIARLIAPKLKQVLDARAVIVQYRGGGFEAVANYIYNRVKPDGLTMLHFALGSRGWSQLMAAPGVEFDVRQFVPVAQFMPPPGAVLMANGNLGVKTVSNLKNLKQFRVGTTSRYSDVQLLSTLLFENFGISNAKWVTGYTGAIETLLAVQKGEIEATAGVTTSVALQRKKDIDTGIYTLFTIYSEKRVGAFPDAPTAFELGEWRADLKPWLETAMAMSQLYNTWVLPPGTPADRVAYLRQVFEEDLWTDAEIKKGLMTLFQDYAQFRPGSEIEQIIKKAFPQTRTFPEADRSWMRQLIDKWSTR